MTNVNIKLTHTELTKFMKDYLDKKMKGITNFLRPEEKVHLEIGAETKHQSGPKYRADVTIMPNSEIYAQAVGKTMQEAIDLCIPRVKSQLVKRKAKAITKRKK
jgi:ribosomal subunit interface protein